MIRNLWNNGWKFTDLNGRLDSAVVDLPHDAMILEERVPELINGSATGYYPGGCYSYEKQLTLTEKEAGGTVMLEFEGVYQKSSVYVNGEKVGGKTYGYTDFFADITGKVKAGDNSVKVVADNSQIPNSRWYTGSGIYRDVYLWTANGEHILPYGVKLNTKRIHPAVVSVDVRTTLKEKASCRVTFLKDKKSSAELVLDGVGHFSGDITIEDARLWTAESPELYDVEISLEKNGDIIDRAKERFGVRILAWSAEDGFSVNGHMVKFRGGCIHHDHGPLGAKSFKDAEVRKMQIMKNAGFNAVRYAHNPAASAFLEACDEVGMYVMDETFDTWTGTKTEYDYGLYFEEEHLDVVREMIRMAYNHPSVVMYSIGNEIPMMDEEAGKITREMVAFCHKEDSSRAVVNGVNPLLSTNTVKKADKSKRYEQGNPRREGKVGGVSGSFLFNVVSTHFSTVVKLMVNEKKMRKVNHVLAPLDIVGFNYGNFLYEPQHTDYPDRIIVGSETYPREIAAYWEQVKRHDYVVGDFTWTSWDYLGEAGVGAPTYGRGPAFTRPYPCVSAACSNIDLIGDIKCQGEYFKIVYGLTKKPYLAVHPVKHSGEKISYGSWALTDAVHSWSWRGCDGRKAQIDVYADANEVELFLNERSFGRKKLKDKIASYAVKYEPGRLKAVSYDTKGKILGEDVLISASADTKVMLIPEKEALVADRQSLVYVDIAYMDENGIVDAMADKEICVNVYGEAELIGTGSGNPYTEYDFFKNKCRTYYGKAVAVLRSTGKTGNVTVTVTDETNSSYEIELTAKK